MWASEGRRQAAVFSFLVLQLLIFDIWVPEALFVILSVTAAHCWLSRFNAFDFLRGLISALKCVKWLNKVLARGQAGAGAGAGAVAGAVMLMLVAKHIAQSLLCNQKWAGNVRSFASVLLPQAQAKTQNKFSEVLTFEKCRRNACK